MGNQGPLGGPITSISYSLFLCLNSNEKDKVTIGKSEGKSPVIGDVCAVVQGHN